MRTLSAHQESHGLSTCAGVDIDAINYATKCTSKIKAKFSCCDQINFDEPVLKPGTPEEQHIAKQEMLTSSTWKPACYLSKITLKPNCNYVPADGVVHTQKRKCLNYLLGRWQKKCNRDHKSFQKRSITLKSAWLPRHFMLPNGSGKPIQHMISFWLWAEGI